MGHDYLEMTPGLQCCLRCGRVLTDRALHDALEEPALASIRAEHPDWAGSDGVCQPCVTEYRHLLHERQARAARVQAAAQQAWPLRVGRWVERLMGAGQG